MSIPRHSLNWIKSARNGAPFVTQLIIRSDQASMHLRFFTMIPLAVVLVTCSRPTTRPSSAAEQLMCGDSTMPRATYARAARAARSDSLSGIAIVVEDSSHRRIKLADVQAWGPTGATGGPGNASGTTVFADRDPGLYSLRIRLEETSPRWIYAATLRPRYVDTVIVTMGTRCTLIWRGR
jgi:hypothetical protein